MMAAKTVGADKSSKPGWREGPKGITYMRSFTETQKIVQELTVHGYLRLNYNETFPRELMGVCVSFYLLLRENWSRIIRKSGQPIHASEKANLLDHANKCFVNTLSNKNIAAAGSLMISRGDFQTWTFKITEYNENGVIFGIHTILNDPNKYRFGCGLNSATGKVSYGNKADKTSKEYCQPFGKGDIVEMVLNMRGNTEYGSLSFKINGEKKGIATDIIGIDSEYYMRTALTPHSSVKILDV